MKRVSLTLALLLTTLMSFSQNKDSGGHTLVSLWKVYYQAEEADKPQDQAAALETIKTEALRRHLPWDFYDAATRYVDVKASVNWKERPALVSALEKEIDQCGEPVALFYHKRRSWQGKAARDYVEANKERLMAGYNPEFHAHDTRLSQAVFAPLLRELISNDYEYALWSLFMGDCPSEIEAWYKDKYPAEGLIEFRRLSRYMESSKYASLQELAARYGGKAVSLLPRQSCLLLDKRSLDRNTGSGSADYKALRESCAAFEKDMAAFSGSEKLIAGCCTEVQQLIRELDSKSLDASVKDRKVSVSLRNVPSFTLSVLDGNRKLHEAKVPNPVGSYYLLDEVQTVLPDLDDGEYTLRCVAGDCKNEKPYSKHTLSVAARADAEGWAVYVADYMSGKPLEACDLVLLDADGKEICRAPEVHMDGFTALPEPLKSQFGSKFRSLALRAEARDASGRKMLSEDISVTAPNPGKPNPAVNSDTQRALLLSDRGAYNPTETVRWKAVLYSGTYEYKLTPAGVPVLVSLLDPDGNEVDSVSGKTGDFGSLDGFFSLPGSGKGGMYTLRISSGSVYLSSKYIRVDEFVLPTFSVDWDEDRQMYLCGDTLRYSGRVHAYSGHSLAGVSGRYEILGHGADSAEGDLQIAPDGSFSFCVKTPENFGNSSWPTRVTITDGTGETLSFESWKWVNYSIPYSLSLLNTVPGRYSRSGENTYGRSGGRIVRDDCAKILFDTQNRDREGLEFSWTLSRDGKLLRSGKSLASETLALDLSGMPSGLYDFKVKASAPLAGGSVTTNDRELSFVKAADDDTALDMDVSSFFKELGGNDIALQIGCTQAPVWAVVELMGSGNRRLDQQTVILGGGRGGPGSLKTISYERRPDWPESLSLHVLWFLGGSSYSYTRSIELEPLVPKLPLSFTRFTDLARPGQKCSLLIQTEPGVECAASIYDKATETISDNCWGRVLPVRRPRPGVSYSDVCGSDGTRFRMFLNSDSHVLAKSAAAGVRGAVMNEMVLQESAMEDAGAAPEAEAEISVRENFDATMAWEPALRSDADGLVRLEFTGSDRLSTYYVQLFAHGEGFKNETLRREMQVSVPVKLSIVQPQFLYAGDRYVSRITLASTMTDNVSGRVSLRFLDGPDYKTARVLGTKDEAVTLAPGGTAGVAVPFVVPSTISTLGVLVNFISDDAADASDALFVQIPVKLPVQTLTEAHSALLKAGADKEALLAGLRSQFVNISGESLESVERSIIDMIREAVPDMVEPGSDNVMALTEAWYANVLARRLGSPGLGESAIKEIQDKIAACQNRSGGISWFEGMESSPVLTAAVLQRIASLDGESSGSLDVEAAVKYLDEDFLSAGERPWWCGGISLPVYLQTRALYPLVPFKAPSGKAGRQLRKDIKAYLVPAKARGLNARILDKARRLRTLQSLLQLPGGDALAKSWGISLRRSLRKSFSSDVESLFQYAVEHPSGGFYYPNAVMPWRGLLESELYAHALLCDLLSSAGSGEFAPASSGRALQIAEGIRLWIMVQKETQQWSDDAACLEAISSVLRGTEQTLQTKVILLSGSFTKPFPEIRQSGNGMTVSRSFSVGDRLLADGDVLHVGDRVVARYHIWSEENRSFVRLSAPRPACMRPVQQLSGRHGWSLKRLDGPAWSFTPQGYRNVLSDKTEYFFDSYPEENTTITEEFFVTQEGSFQTPAVEIESLYAPHYRANDTGRGPLNTE